MRTLSIPRLPAILRLSSPGTRGLLSAIASAACLLAAQGASAAAPAITARWVYADPCTSVTTSNTNPSINSSSCSNTSFKSTNSGHTVVDTFTTANGDYVAFPSLMPTGNSLVVFLGGTASNPNSYTQFIERAAHKGNAAISLSYPNGATDSTIQDICGASNPCYLQLRGGSAFGTGIKYDGTSNSKSYIAVDCSNSTPTGCSSFISATNASSPDPTCTVWTDSTHFKICYKDSIVGRLVAALQSIQANVPAGIDPTAWQNYWAQFSTTTNSTAYHGYLPKWSRIILSGHSQGGGEAAFLAMNLPPSADSSTLANRVVLFSAPEDNLQSSGDACYSPPAGNTNYTPALWVGNSSNSQNNSGIPVNRFWGLRSADTSGASTEACYGAQVATNWSSLAGAGIPQGNGTVILDDGSCLFYNGGSNGAVHCPTAPSGTGQHRFVLTAPRQISDLYNHDAGSVDYNPSTPNWSYENPNVAYIWDRLLTASP